MRNVISFFNCFALHSCNSIHCCVNTRRAVSGSGLQLAFIPTVWLNELQRWATMPVWKLLSHLGPWRAPVDRRPQLETGLGRDQSLWGGRYGRGSLSPMTEVSLCICSVDLYAFTQLCNLESTGSTPAVPSVLFEVPWRFFFFALKHSSKGLWLRPRIDCREVVYTAQSLKSARGCVSHCLLSGDPEGPWEGHDQWKKHVAKEDQYHSVNS